MYISPDGSPQGYIFYQVKDKVLTIHDLVVLNEEARLGIWKFIADHDSMIEKVIAQGPSDDPLPFLLAEPRIKQEIIPYFMARIVDVQVFLQNYSFSCKETEEVSQEPFMLALSDSHAEWNNGLFKLFIQSSGPNEIVKLDDEADGIGFSYNESNRVLSCDIQTLSALLMGYKQASFLRKIGRLQGTEEEVARLEGCLPARTTYLTDFF